MQLGRAVVQVQLGEAVVQVQLGGAVVQVHHCWVGLWCRCSKSCVEGRAGSAHNCIDCRGAIGVMCVHVQV